MDYLSIGQLILVPLLLVLVPLVVKLHLKHTTGMCHDSSPMVGKVVIVTGANIGIGYATAKDLAERGARVIITTIDDELGVEARDKIIQETGNSDVNYYHLDLSSFASTRNFANIILQTEHRLDVLINNAGIFFSNNVQTDNGLLLGLQVNYFGPFLLTMLLLPLLKKSAPSRIINVASLLHKAKIDFKDLNMDKVEFKTQKVYTMSKMYMMITTMEMARQLKNDGVTVNCLNPGVTHTGKVQESGINSVLVKLFYPFLAFFIKSPYEGAQTSIYLAVSPELSQVTGEYFSDCKIQKIIDQIRDPNVGKKLYDMSIKMVNFLDQTV